MKIYHFERESKMKTILKRIQDCRSLEELNVIGQEMKLLPKDEREQLADIFRIKASGLLSLEMEELK
jgi:hypothetical protein